MKYKRAIQNPRNATKFIQQVYQGFYVKTYKVEGKTLYAIYTPEAQMYTLPFPSLKELIDSVQPMLGSTIYPDES